MKIFSRFLMLGAMMIMGCAELISSTSCLTSLCPSTGEYVATIDWHPKLLSHKKCPTITGNYEGKDLLYSQFYFGGLKDDSHKSNIQVSYESYRQIPFIAIEVPRKYMPGQKVIRGQTVILEDTTAFYNQAITSIAQNDKTMTITLLDEDGLKYKQTIVNLDHPNIGCAHGALVIRDIIVIGSDPETGLGFAYADENRFQKLSNGNLQIIRQRRDWYYSNSRGLIGQDADGHVSGTKPRKSKVTQIFPTVK